MIDFAVNIGATEQVAATFPGTVGTLLGMTGIALLLTIFSSKTPYRRKYH